MKKMTLILAMTALLAACKNNRSAENTVPASANNSSNTTALKQSVNNTGNQNGYTSAATHEARKKKGISKAAKGAIIGGTAGAITVGVITKSGKGAVAGGILGAGAGYLIGRNKDKRDGRVQ